MVDRSAEMKLQSGSKRPLYTILESQTSNSVRSDGKPHDDLSIKKQATGNHRYVILDRPEDSSDDEVVMNTMMMNVSSSKTEKRSTNKNETANIQSHRDRPKGNTKISHHRTSEDPPKFRIIDYSSQSSGPTPSGIPWTSDEDQILVSFLNEHENIDFLTEGAVLLRSLFSQLQPRTMSEVRERGHKLQRDRLVQLIAENTTDSLKMPNVGTLFSTQGSEFTPSTLLEYLKKPIVIKSHDDARLRDQSVRVYISNLIKDRTVETDNVDERAKYFFV